jgi:hypothetical protein
MGTSVKQQERVMNKATKTYAVYQVPFENDLIRDIRFMDPLEVEAVSDQFELVGTVEASGPEEVFYFGNMQRSKFTVLGEMVSVSVGDIIEEIESGKTWVVDNIGFVLINMKEAA